MSLRKIVFILFGVIVIQCIILALIPWADHADYHENDTYSYYTYTDVSIKKAPRISSSYYFTYDAPQDGLMERSSIVYLDGDVEIIKVYLEKLGYYLSELGSVEDGEREEYWFRTDGGGDMFTISYGSENDTIILTKVSS
ncbi:hypothetical protein MUU46_05195 [Scandinavium sp. TWS1a]|uniref:hypothetical protein n=1 Tax=Scandinavium tedordense TaxID=2926521 RepID=UPI002166767C|nr:hypothetical protein [Scandinavium tedordense]MCS2169716.1 hypothetical protein [Scandinavium tedordense]